ncbi:lysophospholipase L1-like esterase [Anoxybacillus tengchongensis]|uniref:Lysophospholipase L1-like esterase n=1 Tax=Anoxybacillus tengchongensis TaxID=576944 RepID=A0A7W9YQQ3_9BACL|nr:SGNH/GDSL hydrolase family protein [Anoxybacillus tengchongensis]MBB6176369.1 lysophospholipase L1-like esterase [Anoxybacillus tengchongensis]
MATYQTPNIGLNKWAETDYFKRIEVNENFDKIDDQFSKVNDKIGILNKTIHPHLITDESFRRTIKKLRSAQPVTIVCIGSSSTEGVGYGVNTQSETYPGQLQSKLQAAFPNSTITVHNKGIGGQTIVQMLDRFSSDVFALNPDLVIWQTGTVEAINGSNYDVYMTFLETGAQYVLSRDIDLALMDSQYYPGTGETASYQKYMLGMAEIGARLGIATIPRYSYMKWLVETRQYAWSQLLHTDNFHQSKLMNELIAQLIVDNIKPNISTSASRDYRVEFYDVNHPLVKATLPSGSSLDTFSNTNNPEQYHYSRVWMPNTEGNNRVEFELSFFGKGARFIMPFSLQHDPGMYIEVTVDGGTPKIINQSPRANVTYHQGAFTLADNLSYGFHTVKVAFVNRVGVPGHYLYVTGFDVFAEDSIQISALERLLGRRVLWGLNVAPDSFMNIRVYVGAVFANGREVTIKEATNGTIPVSQSYHVMPISAANPTNPRIDLVYVNEVGKIDIITGTPSANPTAPNVPQACWGLAQVRVPAGAKSSSEFTITDIRKMYL